MSLIWRRGLQLGRRGTADTQWQSGRGEGGGGEGRERERERKREREREPAKLSSCAAQLIFQVRSVAPEKPRLRHSLPAGGVTITPESL